MRIQRGKRGRKGAYALVMVLLLAAVSTLIYAGAHGWTCSTTVINDRNNVYNRTVAAAEGATERVLSYVTRDFLHQSYDPEDLEPYRNLVPVQEWAADFEFCDGASGPNRTFVDSSRTMVSTNLESQFRGLYGLVYSCQVRSQARALNTPYENITAAVQQELQLASIPVFQFAIFYSMDLEINPGAQMTVTGKVHSNADIYAAPVVGLRFLDDVAATGKVKFYRHPDDPTEGTKVMPVFEDDDGYVENVSSLTLPISSNNSPAAVQGILDVPPFNEPYQSLEGKQRYYNNCDLIVSVTHTNVLVQTGRWNNMETVNPDVNPGLTNASYSFVKTNASFYDGREKKWTLTTDIDVNAMRNWMANGSTGGQVNDLAKSTLGRELASIYVDDRRSAAGKLTVARVVNGRYLPNSGLTVATSRPLYVKGHFNAPDTSPGSTNTTATKPASLVGDAITVLSGDWSDANSGTPMNKACDTTVNAAFLAGIVPTTNYFGTKHYSGGVENFPRLLEDWRSRSLTYNGSMVIMFPSRFATGFWVQTGTYYHAPTRRWAFDLNFLDYRKLPPATPQVRKLIRGKWSVVAAN